MKKILNPIFLTIQGTTRFIDKFSKERCIIQCYVSPKEERRKGKSILFLCLCYCCCFWCGACDSFIVFFFQSHFFVFLSIPFYNRTHDVNFDLGKFLIFSFEKSNLWYESSFFLLPEARSQSDPTQIESNFPAFFSCFFEEISGAKKNVNLCAWSERLSTGHFLMHETQHTRENKERLSLCANWTICV